MSSPADIDRIGVIYWPNIEIHHCHPRKAGIQYLIFGASHWVPAFAGMTNKTYFYCRLSSERTACTICPIACWAN